MLQINLLTEKSAANKYSDIFLRIDHNICKIKVTLSYFSYINISYQMYKTWSCWTFHHSLNRFPQGNDDRVSTSWKWFNMEVYTRFTWFHFTLDLSYFSGFLRKRPLLKEKGSQNFFWQPRNILKKFENVSKKT